jgi:hypothetical protein
MKRVLRQPSLSLRSILASAAIVFAWVLVGSAAPGLLLNVNFAANDRVKVGFAATGQTSTDFWNNYTAPWQTFVVSSNLTAADGTPTSVDLTVENGPGQWGFAFPDLMYNCYIYSQNFGDVTLAVTNLPSGSYDIYLYGHAAADNANTVFETSVDATDYGIQSTATNSDWSLTNWVEGAQYVVFREVVVANEGAAVVIKAHPGLSGYTQVNGMQIQSAGPRAPAISVQPNSQNAVLGQDVTFSVSAFGSTTLAYQWSFNGTSLAGATSSSLTLTNVQMPQAGQYSVQITNSLGSVTSSNAVLTVNYPPALVQLSGGIGVDGGSISLPLTLVANGNENGLGFTLNYDSSLLQFTGITLANAASNATLVLNTTQTNDGLVGVLLALPTGSTFIAGTQEIAEVSFNAGIVTNLTSTEINFGNTPVKSQVSDSSGNFLSASFIGATVTLPPVEYEADVAPRPHGDGEVTVGDWVLIGRFVAGLDSPTNATEFERADCAPRSTRGDGLLTVADWVQAGRYAAGLDPLTPIGGPLSPNVSPTISKRTSARENARARLLQAILQSGDGQTCSAQVVLQAQGNENAVAFSLLFDPTQFNYIDASLGSAMAGGTLNLNSLNAPAGRLGVLLALSPGSTFSAGSTALLTLTFRTPFGPKTSLQFADQPVSRGVSDAQASELAADFTVMPSGSLPASLRITASQQTIAITWPSWATNCLLQQSADPSQPSSWRRVPGAPQVNGAENSISLPLGPTNQFFRLFRP